MSSRLTKKTKLGTSQRSRSHSVMPYCILETGFHTLPLEKRNRKKTDHVTGARPHHHFLCIQTRFIQVRLGPHAVNMLLKLLVLLLSTIYYAGCASLQKACIPCALSCDDAHVLKEHERVHVEVEHQSVCVFEDTLTVSSLWKYGSCSVVVLDCSKYGKDAKFVLRFYADNDGEVPEQLYHKTLSMPDCVSSVASIEGDAGGVLSNKLLILLPVCLCIYCFKGPRCAARSSGRCSSGEKGPYYHL